MRLKPRAVAKRNELLSLLGLSRRARALVPGAEGCRRAIHDGVARVVVIAGDAAPGQRKKVMALASAKGVPMIEVGTRVAIGHAVGAPPLTAVAITQATLAARVLALGSSPTPDAGSGKKSQSPRNPSECG